MFHPPRWVSTKTADAGNVDAPESRQRMAIRKRKVAGTDRAARIPSALRCVAVPDRRSARGAEQTGAAQQTVNRWLAHFRNSAEMGTAPESRQHFDSWQFSFRNSAGTEVAPVGIDISATLPKCRCTGVSSADGLPISATLRKWARPPSLVSGWLAESAKLRELLEPPESRQRLAVRKRKVAGTDRAARIPSALRCVAVPDRRSARGAEHPTKQGHLVRNMKAPAPTRAGAFHYKWRAFPITPEAAPHSRAA